MHQFLIAAAPQVEPFPATLALKELRHYFAAQKLDGAISPAVVAVKVNRDGLRHFFAGFYHRRYFTRKINILSRNYDNQDNRCIIP